MFSIFMRGRVYGHKLYILSKHVLAFANCLEIKRVTLREVLFDGPEAFHRPFGHGLRLIPAERCREELLRRCRETRGLSESLAKA